MKKAFVVLLLLTLIFATAIAEEDDDYIEAWAMCQPDSYINIRRFAKKDAEVSGMLYLGDKVFLDGKTKRGFVHCVGLNNEDGEGWVAKGYLVYSEPTADGHKYEIKSNGRVAARRTVKGTRRRWLHDGDVITVYSISAEWCLTSEGFVKTDCIDLDQRMDIEPTDPDEMTWEDDAA